MNTFLPEIKKANEEICSETLVPGENRNSSDPILVVREESSEKSSGCVEGTKDTVDVDVVVLKKDVAKSERLTLTGDDKGKTTNPKQTKKKIQVLERESTEDAQ